MKPSFALFKSGLAALAAAAACLAMLAAQAPQGGSVPPAAESFPAPVNLKVLPRDLTGKQVHEIMEQWKTGLGMSCAACHAEDKEKVDEDGRPLLDFASDAKPEKATARLMYAMTEEINQKYIARIDSSGEPVTCGTCHRGHLGPQPFAPGRKGATAAPAAPLPSGDAAPNQ
ncbi:MAG: c-type cytochrome [Terracidiphilus sp.]